MDRERIEAAANQPWICPRCGTVNAWWVARCKCKPPTAPVKPQTWRLG